MHTWVGREIKLKVKQNIKITQGCKFNGDGYSHTHTCDEAQDTHT